MKRILALRALGVGDLLTAVPALRALKRAWPAHVLTLAAPRALAPLVRLIEVVDELAVAEPLTPLPRSVHHADVAVNLHGRGPESHRLLLDTAPERLIAFRHPDVRETARSPVWSRGEHEVARWCRLLEEEGVPADPSALTLAPPPPPVAGLARATLIHPGAKDAARRWPPARFAGVAAREVARKRRVLIAGGPREVTLATEVARLAGLGDGCVIAGCTDVDELAAYVAHVGRVICGDTGVQHLATAFGTPSVVLFGPTPPAEWGPPRGPHIALWAGRRGDPHGLEVDRGLLQISVEQVNAAVERLPPRSA